MQTTTLPRGLVLHRALLRPILLAGAERRLVMINMTLIATLLLGVGLYPLTVVCGLLLATLGHWCLVQAAQADPMMTAIYLRHIRYDDVYVGSGLLSRHHNRFPSLPERLFFQ